MIAGALGSVPGDIDHATLCGLYWHRHSIARMRSDELAKALARVIPAARR